jgi:Ner family transcriptional regulator
MHGTTLKVDPRVKEQSRIKAKLLEAGITLADIDRTYGLTSGAARNAMREPNQKGERAIAAALGTRPHLLWPTRYRPSGQRRSPQEWTRVPTLKQRRNEQAA